MTPPPKYPRVPHLVSRSSMDADDRVLDATGRACLLEVHVVVEEKLDGANVAVWFEAGVPRVATRGGPDTVDRGGHRGRLRAWVAEHADNLRAGLGEDLVLYGEWMLARHQVRYARLPSPLIGLDVRDRRSNDFLVLSARDHVLEVAGVSAPPRIFEGVLGGVSSAEHLIGVSAYGDEQAEGIVIRAGQSSSCAPRIAKLIAPEWTAAPDADWSVDENTVLAG